MTRLPADEQHPSCEESSDPNEQPAAQQGEPDSAEAPADPFANGPLTGLRIAFLGKLGGMNRREAQQLVRSHGGIPVEPSHRPLDLLVWGAEQRPLDSLDDLDPAIRAAADRGEFELVSETQLWQRLGLVENEANVKRLYTPAMLAQLLDVPITIVRRWHRRGLIVPERVVHRLPYFDFQEVATARRLAQLLAAGDSPSTIERKLASLNKQIPSVQRPLAQLSVIIEGRQLLLRQGQGLIEPGGQRRLDFNSSQWEERQAETESVRDDTSAPSATVPIEQILALQADHRPSVADLLADARSLEDDGLIDAAIELYRAALLAGGPNPTICFQLAELLYQSGATAAARERYAMALELDENYVEARANLGCVLMELGQTELAIAAFQGALASHPDYPDVHYHLARLLDSLDRPEEALAHWHRFLELSPDSPWADEAAQRLEDADYLG